MAVLPYILFLLLMHLDLMFCKHQFVVLQSKVIMLAYVTSLLSLLNHKTINIFVDSNQMPDVLFNDQCIDTYNRKKGGKIAESRNPE